MNSKCELCNYLWKHEILMQRIRIVFEKPSARPFTWNKLGNGVYEVGSPTQYYSHIIPT